MRPATLIGNSFPFALLRRDANVRTLSLNDLRSALAGAEIVSLDPGVTRFGCSFGLKLPCKDVARLKAAMDRQGIPYGEVIGGTGKG